MTVLLTLALASTATVLPQCSWDRPGANAFQGDVVAAVDRYTDIPVATRLALKKRIAARTYDELVEITRDAVTGSKGQYSDLRDMHFGKGAVCRTVSRTQWKPDAKERGLVYCEQDQCIIIPTVCRNVSRITRTANRPAAAAGPSGGAPAQAAVPVQEAPAAPAPVIAQAQPDPLMFESPSSGVSQALGGGPLTESFPLYPAAGRPTFESLAGLPTLASLPGTSSSGPGLPPAPVVLYAGPVNFDPVPGITPVLLAAETAVGVVPEPTSWMLLLAGVAALVLLRKANPGFKTKPGLTEINERI
jgi:hypothetical protein